MENEILEAPPTNAQMQEALGILHCSVQHRATNYQRHYKYEQFIQVLLENKPQTTLEDYFPKNSPVGWGSNKNRLTV